jgi:tripartite ATP-independent transporter DctM subunit
MGLDISIGWLTLIMFGSLLVLLMAGLPLAFVTGGLACVFLFLIGDSWQILNIVPSRIFPLMTDYQLSAIPLFIFMAAMLERAGLINQMFDVIYKLLGGIRGGLASATIIASTILAAMVGVIGAAVVTMGIIALPAMLRREYDTKIAMGAIMAGGTLGILIPPSILAIIYAVVAEQSVGELFIGAVIPGLMLSSLYILYVTIMCFIFPEKGPAIPEAERISFKAKLLLVGDMAAPILLIVTVLGVIFSGAATPVEAAGIGTFGSFIVAALHGRLTWQVVRAACITTLKASAMVIWIMFGATIFVGLYVLEGGQQFVTDALNGSGLGPWGILILMQVILVFLGMFLDWVGILLLCVPIFVPIVKGLGAAFFGLDSPDDLALWFGVLYLVNMQMSFLSPPFGYALFYLRGVAPAEIPMSDIFKSALPFLALQILGLTVCMLFPELVIWLPRQVYG